MPLPCVGEVRHENRLAGELSSDGADEFLEHPLLRFRTVAHAGLEVDALFHVVHGTGFGDDGFAGIEFHFDDLHVVAENLIVDFMAFHSVSPFSYLFPPRQQNREAKVRSCLSVRGVKVLFTVVRLLLRTTGRAGFGSTCCGVFSDARFRSR